MRLDSFFDGALIKRPALCLSEIVESALRMFERTLLVRIMELVEVWFWPESPVFWDASPSLRGVALLQIPGRLIPGQQSVIENSRHLAGSGEKPAEIR